MGDKKEEQKRVESLNGKHDFWTDATSFLKTIVDEDATDKIAEHMKKRNFNDNEMRLFREYIGKAFEIHPMFAHLKLQCDNQSETEQTKEK